MTQQPLVNDNDCRHFEKQDPNNNLVKTCSVCGAEWRRKTPADPWVLTRRGRDLTLREKQLWSRSPRATSQPVRNPMPMASSPPEKRLYPTVAEKEATRKLEKELATEKSTPGIVPPPATPATPRRSREWFEQNKTAILKDYYDLKTSPFLHKWELSSGTWQNLRKRWQVKGKRKPHDHTPSPGRTSGIPAWDESWPENVKRDWLRANAVITVNKNLAEIFSSGGLTGQKAVL